MYPILLPLHSLLRWLVLASLLIAICRSYYGWLGRKTYSGADDQLRHITTKIVHLQFIAGVWLYLISPVTSYFISHFNEAVHLREIRFFGLEHSSMMLTGIALISIGSAKAKTKETGLLKYKTQAIWFTIGLLVILSSVPWAFSPLVHRPWFRGF